ncbi:MAG: hypothetical protein AAB851_00490, partial [Patescibacteria group bacterium]
MFHLATNSKYINFSFKAVCFLTIFVLAFGGFFGGIILKPKVVDATWLGDVAEWINAIVNIGSLVANLTGADWLAQILNYVKTLTNLYQTFSNNANTQD